MVPNSCIISPVPHLLGTNLAPSDVEISAIRSHVILQQFRFARVVSSLAFLPVSSSPALAFRCHKLLHSISSHQPLLSVSRRVPPEIWSSIFLLALPNEDTQFIIPRSDQAPQSLTGVSTGWRALALAIPQLWTSQHVHISRGIANPRLPLSALWIERANGLPLSLSMHEGNSLQTNQVIANELLDSFMNITPQWRHVRLHLAGKHSQVVLGVFHDSPRTRVRRAPARILESLEVKAVSRLREELEELFALSQHSPLLSKISLQWKWHFSITGQDLNGRLPWERLSNLSLDDVPSVAHCLHLLQRCVSLEKCTFVCKNELVERTDDIISEDERVVHERLHHLNITIQEAHLGAFLDNVALPKLVSLSLCLSTSPTKSVWPRTAFSTFLTKSNSLKSLYVHFTLIVVQSLQRLRKIDENLAILLEGAEAPVLKGLEAWGSTLCCKDETIDEMASRWIALSSDNQYLQMFNLEFGFKGVWGHLPETMLGWNLTYRGPDQFELRLGAHYQELGNTLV